ncbi:MAG: ECs_2282 family putative zinc-binding protein [Syntrophobacteraceae bacterium]
MKSDNIVCPDCGNKALKPGAKTRTDDIPDNVVCPKCGRNISKDEIKRQLSKIAEKIIRDSFFKIGK